jgi:hypothetical protein
MVLVSATRSAPTIRRSFIGGVSLGIIIEGVLGEGKGKIPARRRVEAEKRRSVGNARKATGGLFLNASTLPLFLPDFSDGNCYPFEDKGLWP